MNVHVGTPLGPWAGKLSALATVGDLKALVIESMQISTGDAIEMAHLGQVIDDGEILGDRASFDLIATGNIV